MSVDFKRAGLLRKEALLLATTPGASGAGQVVFLTSHGTSDRVHRMDLARLRRFSVTRESRAVKLSLLLVTLGLLLLWVLGLLWSGGPVAGWAALVIGIPAAAVLVAAVVALLQVRVRLAFEDATRTRDFVTWTWPGKLRRFEERLESAVAEAQAG